MPRDADVKCWPMREVYDRMHELGKMPYIRNFDKLVTSPDYDTCSIEIPKWIIALRSAFTKFECMETWLPYEQTCTFHITSDTTPQLQKAILSFSTEIFKCQARFPGQTLLCQHALMAWQHLNIICMHCRTYQMILFSIAQVATHTSATAVLFVARNTQKRNERDEAVPTTTTTPEATTNQYYKGIPVANRAPPVPTVYPLPTAPEGATTDTPWITDNKAKLEVQDLLQMLQTTASPRTNARFTF